MKVPGCAHTSRVAAQISHPLPAPPVREVSPVWVSGIKYRLIYELVKVEMYELVEVEMYELVQVEIYELVEIGCMN